MTRTPLWRRYSRLFGADPAADVKDELSFHLEAKIDDLVAQGWSPDAARVEAERQFGDLRALEQIGARMGEKVERRRRIQDYWSDLLQDVRFTFRTLGRDPGFALVSILILALAIGANVAVFSVVNTLVLRPLPLRNADRLVWLDGNKGSGGLSDKTFRVDAYEEIVRRNRSFQEVTGYVPFFATTEARMKGRGQAQQLTGVWVEGNFFQVLGIKPALGRLFTSEESLTGARPVVLLSYPFWQREFRANPAIVGQVITLNDLSVTVIGVLPASFDFGSTFHPGMNAEIFVPAINDRFRRWGHMLSIIAVLRPGVTVEQAQAEMDIDFTSLIVTHPDWTTDFELKVSGLKNYISGKLRRSLVVLWCAVGLIMLIACVNLSNLLLARAAARSKELAMRRALGAGRLRLIRQLLTESLILSFAGSLLGLVLAFGLTAFLARESTIALPLLSSVRVDVSALQWTLFIAVAAAVAFGVAPAFSVSGGNPRETLHQSGYGASAGKLHDRMRATLVISEVALACVLLVGAGLLLRSFLRVLDVDLGFEPSHAAAMKLNIDDGGNFARRGALLQEKLRRVATIPGVEAAGISDKLPLDRNRSWDLSAKGRAYPPDTNHDAYVYIVTPGYFNVMGMHLREGRDFTWDDKTDSAHVIVINEAAARRDWPGEDPIGRLAQGIGNGDSRVIGVISDVHDSAVEDLPNPEVFVPITQGEPEGAELVIRTSLPPSTLATSVMHTLRELNPNQSVAAFRPIQSLVDHSNSPRRFFMLLVAVFAGLGLLLAALGIYGVISYSVAQRTQEIGIRMALGASTGRVQREVMLRMLRLALSGMILGALASLAVARLIASLLFATLPCDPFAYVAMALALLSVALISGYLPARRASRIEPMIALRSN
jgi:predicted permease